MTEEAKQAKPNWEFEAQKELKEKIIPLDPRDLLKEFTIKDIFEEFLSTVKGKNPDNTEELSKLAHRLRQVGYLNDQELTHVLDNPESFLKTLSGGNVDPREDIPETQSI